MLDQKSKQALVEKIKNVSFVDICSFLKIYLDAESFYILCSRAKRATQF
jgi:hypothetical protein